MTERPPPIGQHRMLSDGRSTALVTPNGEIDWWCWPRPASSPLCWSLLDTDGGRARWVDASLVDIDGMPAGPTAHTTLRVDGLLVETIDAIVDVDGHSELVRLARGVDEDLDVEHELRVGGFDAPAASWHGNRAQLDAGRCVWLVGGSTTIEQGLARTRLAAPHGEWASLTVGPREHSDTAATILERAVHAEEQRADLIRTCAVPHHHAERARHALSVIEASADADTGAVFASSTTSLPEVVGGNRQFDYRYSWLRDSSMAVAVALLLGQVEVARRYVSFLSAGDPDDLVCSPVRDVSGAPVPDERCVAGVGGWFGSQPVKVGNAAGQQFQLDALGFVVDAVALLARRAGHLSSNEWDIVVALADHAATAPAGTPTSGIWELRTPANLVSADIGRWIVLDRALALRRRFRPWSRRTSWRRARRAARDRVIGALRTDGTLPQAYGGDRPDASGLLAVIYGILSPSDPRATRLVDGTIRALGAGPLLYRYPPDGSDGFSPGEAPFVPTSWWAVTALALLGEKEAAAARAHALCALLPALMPEQFAPARGEALGNVPLVWSHAECARALFTLDRAGSLRARMRRAAGRAIRKARS
jgi:hypothetical protein